MSDKIPLGYVSTKIVEYNQQLLTKNEMINQIDYFHYIRDNFNSKLDISFMNYFMELTNDLYGFWVPHEKLIEYGAMSQIKKDSYHIKRCLDKLNLDEGVDYKCETIDIQRDDSSIIQKKQYMLTPHSFELCLIRATKHKNRDIDPTIYANYFIFLQLVFKRYNDYQKDYNAHMHNLQLKNKDCTINELKIEVKQLNNNVEKLGNKIDNQTEKIDQLTSLTKNMIIEVKHIMTFFMPLMTTLSKTWYGSNVFNTQLSLLSTTPSKIDHTFKLKFLFCVGFYKKINDERAELIVYFCNRNLGNANIRISELYEKHKDDYDMFKPLAICLFSQEVNLEHSMLNNIFEERDYDMKTKSFTFNIKCANKGQGFKAFLMIHTRAMHMRYHIYQNKFDNYRRNNLLDPKILDRVMQDDTMFYKETRPFCQTHLEYLVSKIINENNKTTGYKPEITSENKIKRIRTDLDDKKMSNIVYNIIKLKSTIESMKDNEYASKMIKDDIITDRDVYYLRRVSEIEGFDIPGIPHSSEL